jgi:hypothetical protein
MRAVPVCGVMGARVVAGTGNALTDASVPADYRGTVRGPVCSEGEP